MSAEQMIVETLGDLGFSANAAKTYITLLRNNPATGYEVSKRAGIPRSAIYTVLNHLESMNIINGVGESPRRFIPLPPSTLLEHFSQLTSDRLDTLKTALDSLELKEEAFDFWHITGYKDLILRARETINGSMETLFLGIWRKEYDKLVQEIRDAVDRGVDIIIFSFCDIPPELGSVISYGIDEDELLEIWNPKIILVSDQKVTIMGQLLIIRITRPSGRTMKPSQRLPETI